MPNWTYDPTGVPFLTDLQIEKIAASGLGEHYPQCLVEPKATPILEILTLLQNKYGVKFGFVDFPSKDGKRTIGKVVFSENLMLFHSDLQKDELRPMFRFTAAHEIGHWSLHRYKKVFEVGDIEEGDSEMEIRYRERGPKPARWWMEHQANVFAASLLMPRNTFQEAVNRIQRQLGIANRIGTVYLDNQQVNIQTCSYIVTTLSETFGVSKTATRIRLEETGILADARHEGIRSIKQIVIEALPKTP